MLSIEQLTIVAYFAGECEILCRKCGEAEGLPAKEAICAYSAGEYAGNEGLTCDGCGKEIVEPYSWTCPTCGADYVGEEAALSEEEHDAGNGCGSVNCKEDED